MKSVAVPLVASCCIILVISLLPVARSGETARPTSEPYPNVIRSMRVIGTVQELRPNVNSVIIHHDAITNYMAEMTMPFKVKQAAQLAGLSPGNRISFRLLVTDDESWIDQITILETGTGVPPEPASRSLQKTSAKAVHPLMRACFTNQLGQAVTLNDFHGQALAITFFFTRCPIPEYCPRLSRNFAEASQKLIAMDNAPTNWHFLSVTFDPNFDTPAVLETYGRSYHYDPHHWSFLTGAAGQLAELARQSGVDYKPEAGFFNHNFRTLIIDAAGHMQMAFPVSGDLSDAIVREMLKAAVATNKAT
jgi:protein SCO1/2